MTQEIDTKIAKFISETLVAANLKPKKGFENMLRDLLQGLHAGQTKDGGLTSIDEEYYYPSLEQLTSPIDTERGIKAPEVIASMFAEEMRGYIDAKSIIRDFSREDREITAEILKSLNSPDRDLKAVVSAIAEIAQKGLPNSEVEKDVATTKAFIIARDHAHKTNNVGLLREIDKLETLSVVLPLVKAEPLAAASVENGKGEQLQVK